jgi:protein-S-isoprenylcysteine O-methyltransferase Ste14
MILVGWGRRNLKAFTDEPARVAALVVASAYMGGVAAMLRLGGRSQKEERSQAVVAALDIASGVLALAVLPYLDARPQLLRFARLRASRFRWVGVALAAFGTSLQLWAMRSMGQWYTPRVAILEGHQLVSTGPYRWLRHPAYTGIMAAGTGFSAAFGFWTGLLYFPAGLPVVLRRMDAEERLLAEEFGEEYRAMMDRTWRLLPYVY